MPAPPLLQFTAFKPWVKSFKTSRHRAQRGLYWLALIIWKIILTPVRFLFNRGYRSLALVRILNRHHIHQLSNYTQYDRYPDLFKLCQDLLNGKSELSLLSFGCSYGDEVFTLRRYFPRARICGVDINRHNIYLANQKNDDADIFFSSQVDDAIESKGPYDAIFALSVLQRTENRTKDLIDSSKSYPFEKFDATVTQLDWHLKPGGLLVIDNADYRFSDTQIIDRYTPYEAAVKFIQDRFLYDRNNRRLCERSAVHRIYIKASGNL